MTPFHEEGKMSTRIELSNIEKKYGNNVILPNLNLTIEEGEFFTLLGPSGCGKTTTLRIVAGFTEIQRGNLFFNENDVSLLPPGKRNIGMVFQNYAIFPNMDVKKNVAFGLKHKNLSKAEIEERVDKVLKTVQIYDLKDRMPENMSGGQQQRVALARAIVIRPDLLLMDEPLSNLDAKLRIEMRDVIKKLHKEVGITTIYVTHDQEEAMAVSDRIAVMNKGVVQQIGSPRSIYHRPANLFVANFIGNNNILKANMTIKNGKANIKVGNYSMDIDQPLNINEDGNYKVQLSIRPEDFEVELNNKKTKGLTGTVVSSIYLGKDTNYTILLETGEELKVTQESYEIDKFKEGEKVLLTIDENKVNIFSEDGNHNYCKGVSND